MIQQQLHSLLMFLFRHPSQIPRPFGRGFLFNGLLCILFGLAILIAPELLAYLVALFLLLVGTSLLTAWWKMK